MRSAALFPAHKCVEVCACQIDRLTKAQNGPKSNPQNTRGVVYLMVHRSLPQNESSVLLVDTGSLGAAMCLLDFEIGYIVSIEFNGKRCTY